MEPNWNLTVTLNFVRNWQLLSQLQKAYHPGLNVEARSGYGKMDRELESYFAVCRATDHHPRHTNREEN
jgi:hypothetical protein